MIDKFNSRIPSDHRQAGGVGSASIIHKCDDCGESTGKPTTVMRLRRGPLKGLRGKVFPQCSPTHQGAR
jgi:hypothetical protein